MEFLLTVSTKHFISLIIFPPWVTGEMKYGHLVFRLAVKRLCTVSLDVWDIIYIYVSCWEFHALWGIRRLPVARQNVYGNFPDHYPGWPLLLQDLPSVLYLLLTCPEHAWNIRHWTLSNQQSINYNTVYDAVKIHIPFNYLTGCHDPHDYYNSSQVNSYLTYCFHFRTLDW